MFVFYFTFQVYN